MDLLEIAIRTVVLYGVIIIIFRLMGKREIGELNVLDLVVFLMLSELAVVAIETPDKPIVHQLTPMILLMVLQIVLAFLSLKSQKARKMLDGEPSILIRGGKVDEVQMRKQRYNFDDLLMQLREKDIGDIRDVEYAILEPSGKLSVFRKRRKGNVDTKAVFALPLIIDGTIQDDHLEKIGKTNLWLRQKLRELGYKDITQISYCTVQNDEFFVDLKDE
ncbi:DUF421 domain-containing protein [Ectobacillus antri]|uniref:DUF421 domain-containing protein n=1 Tax=Ectobacillus antri TaxID=2486280 RepID=A0ABT6H432_9BACI|nr:DUF421 domain-containing protein [Ectobacillus antri]MDG4655398.1 DUF421 domain-containing protein [Ectobacillus antri]MDG5753156.1 DUF421 domain-containing protein [Ectobacillus antri]